MPEENVEVVRRMYQAYHGGNAEDALAFYDPNVVVDASVRMDGGIGRGRDELAQIVSGWTDAFDAWSDDIEEMRDLGDTVLVSAHSEALPNEVASRCMPATPCSTRSGKKRSPA